MIIENQCQLMPAEVIRLRHETPRTAEPKVDRRLASVF